MTNSPEAATPDSNPAATDADAPEAFSGASGARAPEAGAPEPGAFESGAPEAGTPEAGTPEAGAPEPGALEVEGLDVDSFDRIREPRSPNRLPLGDGTWHQLARQYVWVQLISTGVMLALVVAAMLVLALVLGQTWAYIPGGILAVILLFTIIVTPRQARAYGYQLRRDDLVFRKGILWQRVVAVPYGRMQLVDITHGPLDRGFGIAQLKLVTAAATTGVTIPGLAQQSAERLRDTLIDVAETRRTGL